MPSRPLLAAAERTRIERLARRFRWKLAATGVLPGRRTGRRLGSAGEFEGYRPFEPGDDLRSLDVKVYARLRRPMARLRRDDSVVPLTLLVDRSASMTGESRARAVASLGLFFVAKARRNGDPVRVLGFRDGQLERMDRDPARLLEHLSTDPAAGSSDFGGSFVRLTADRAGRGMVVVLSDAMGVTQPERELLPLTRIGVPIWIAPLEPEEWQPEFQGRVALHSREREPVWRGLINAHTLRDYRSQLNRYHGALRRHLLSRGGDFVPISTEEALTAVLERLRARQRFLEVS